MKLLSNCLCLAMAFFSLALIPAVDGIMCSVCNSEEGANDCITKPTESKNCTECVSQKNNECLQYSRYEQCVIIRKYINDTLIGLVRGCSPEGGAGSCMKGRDDKRAGAVVEICRTFCSVDGCNSAPFSHRVSAIAMLTLTSGPFIFNMLKYHIWS